MNKRGVARDSRAGMSWNAAQLEANRGAFSAPRPSAPSAGLRRTVRLHTATYVRDLRQYVSRRHPKVRDAWHRVSGEREN